MKNRLADQSCAAPRWLATDGCRSRYLTIIGFAAVLLLTVGFTGEALGETVVYGRVVAVEPVHGRPAAGQAEVTDGCVPRDPSRAEGLIARLRWDLEQRALERSRCLAERVPERYQVTYRWNGQLFTQELPFNPGERIALRLDVR